MSQQLAYPHCLLPAVEIFVCSKQKSSRWLDNEMIIGPIITDADYWICIASDFFGLIRNSLVAFGIGSIIGIESRRWITSRMNIIAIFFTFVSGCFVCRLWQVSWRTCILFPPKAQKISRIHLSFVTVLCHLIFGRSDRITIHARQTHNVILRMTCLVFLQHVS